MRLQINLLEEWRNEVMSSSGRRTSCDIIVRIKNNLQVTCEV